MLPTDHGALPLGGRWPAARFHPAAVALGPAGPLYMADQDHNCIRVVRPAKAAGQP